MSPINPIHKRFPIFGVAERFWFANRRDCSGYVKAVAAELGVPLDGLANHLVDEWNSDPGWIRLGNDHVRASTLSEQGYFVVAGRKEPGHGHVVIVVPGRSSHGDAMGYWGRLGGIGEKDKGLGFAWKRADLKTVQYFAKPVASLKAAP